jgi:site-specific recombinase XerD
MTARPTAPLAELMQAFFDDHLPNQRALSPRTIESYRDALRLLLEFIGSRDARAAAQVALADLTPEVIEGFLRYLEQVRHNSVHSRNIRLAAVRGFLKFAAPWDASPCHAITQSLRVPMTRFVRPRPDFLSREQMQAIIGTHDGSWIAQRDHLMLSLLYNTAASVSEIVRLRVDQIQLDGAGCVHFRGTRRARTVPLWPATVTAVENWLAINQAFEDSSFLLPNQRGAAMTATCIRRRLAIAVRRAERIDPELASRRISPRTIRHTASMHLLQHGTDLGQITRWLGHDTPATMHNHARAFRVMNDRTVSRFRARAPLSAQREPAARVSRESDQLLEFIEAF